MYGCSEEVPSLKAQLLCEEILALCLNKRRESPGLGLMAALEGGPAGGKARFSEGPRFTPWGSPVDTVLVAAPRP